MHKLTKSSVLSVDTLGTGGEVSVHADEQKVDTSKNWVTISLNDRLKIISKDMYKKYRSGKNNWNVNDPRSVWKGQSFKSASIPDHTWNLSGTELCKPTLTDLEPLFFGESELNNTSPNEQTMQTNLFTNTVTISSSTTTSRKFNVGLGAISVPIASLGKLNMTFDTNTSETQSNSEAITMTSPGQSVKVPANKKYKVKISLLRAKYIGTVSLKAESNDNPYSNVTFDGIRGLHTGGIQSKKITEKLPFTSVYEFGESSMFTQQDIEYKYWKENGSSKIKLYVDGTGEYSFQNASQYKVEIIDITESAKTPVVQAYTINS
ncbi:ETX/MTX2 family pore-forming toxin [Bacillus cereus]|uniref:ETX/MTX2 family pore-forming toxin n=1 Tax=Bacillus cereus TaxID=1396 RepID=UPI002ABFE868|nr:ETX/MTX2 family pore-forming toxin [Bacillus cereus]MDZ4417359.1 ETX/MTX2 family pore-forming toxin [Bacillus cereus]